MTLWSRNFFRRSCDDYSDPLWNDSRVSHYAQYHKPAAAAVRWGGLAPARDRIAVLFLLDKQETLREGWQVICLLTQLRSPINGNHGVFSHPPFCLLLFCLLWTAIIQTSGHEEKSWQRQEAVVCPVTTLRSQIHWLTQSAAQPNNNLEHLCWCYCAFNRVSLIQLNFY